MENALTRIAVISDIHGNVLALEAALADIAAAGGVDATWILGDLAAIGPAPVKVLERLAALPNAHFIRGNTDRYVITGELPGPGLDEIRANPALVERAIEIGMNFAWTKGALTATGWLEWLAGLPLDYRAELPGGLRALCVHASPGTDSGKGILPGDDPAQIAGLLAGCDAGLVLVGHTHQAFDLMAGGIRVVNPGSISNPFGPDVRASYAVLHASPDGLRVEHRKAAYDTAAVIAEVQRIGHPAARMIARHLAGEA